MKDIEQLPGRIEHLKAALGQLPQETDRLNLQKRKELNTEAKKFNKKLSDFKEDLLKDWMGVSGNALPALPEPPEPPFVANAKAVEYHYYVALKQVVSNLAKQIPDSIPAEASSLKKAQDCLGNQDSVKKYLNELERNPKLLEECLNDGKTADSTGEETSETNIINLAALFEIYKQRHPQGLYSSSFQFPIQASAQRLEVRLSRTPHTRIRLSFDRDGEHMEIEWEPNIPDSLVKTITLQPGMWQASFWAEPLLRTESPYGGATHYVVVNLNCFRPVKHEHQKERQKVEARAQFLDTLNEKRPKVPFPELTATFTFEELPDPVMAPDLGAKSPLFTVRNVSGRGFTDPLPPGVREAFELLAEIAVERAEARGLALLKDQAEKHLCTDLTWDKILGTRHGEDKPPADQRLLPRTCTVIDSLRLQDVASSARPILRALREDFVWSIVPPLMERIQGELGLGRELGPLGNKVLGIVADIAAGKRPSREHARLLLLELANQSGVERGIDIAINKHLQSLKNNLDADEQGYAPEEPRIAALRAEHQAPADEKRENPSQTRRACA